MDRSRFDMLAAYMQSAWGRELTFAQKEAGWKILAGLTNEAVEGAISTLIDDGGDRLPAWPVILKASRSLGDSRRDRMPALPARDSLSDEEHQAAMIRLRAKQTAEQRRRADRMTSETKGLPMPTRLRLAGELLQLGSRSDAGSWARLFDQALEREEKLLPQAAGSVSSW